MYILGQIFSLLGTLTLIYSTFSKKKKKMMWWQVLNAILYGVSNYFFVAYSAVVTNVFTLYRNVLEVKNKLDKKRTLIICVLLVAVGLYFNNRDWVGLLPIIASVQYTLCVYGLKSAQHMRIALIINLLQWELFDLFIQAYPALIGNTIIIIITIINAIRYRNSTEEIIKKE